MTFNPLMHTNEAYTILATGQRNIYLFPYF